MATSIEKLELIRVALNELDKCLVEAPVDFLGTGNNGKYAKREEKNWRNKWTNALSILNQETFYIEEVLKSNANLKEALGAMVDAHSPMGHAGDVSRDVKVKARNKALNALEM